MPRTATGLERRLRIDLPLGRAQPALWRVVLATAVAIAGSIAACALLAWLGPVLFPRTTGYEHYEFGDYAKLTTIGVVAAGIAWPLVTLVSTHASRLYLWLAVIVTVGSFVPDLWIWAKGQDPEGVFVLVLMHLAVAAVTYPAIVLIAPQPRAADAAVS